ncbi:unnamed protein product [Clonostachys rhizophaga]|uniref:F-box domain-containing protein n=1 Tax=Clonostachys rhizophaga TaxID=160324 RepID=A0A9N9VR63_9HYPO|nr:unnamed protein product [Clonostachys rhizophaga]
MRQESTPPLLRLPPKIRERIYFFAGLIRECPATIVPFGKLTTHFCPWGQRPAIDTCAFELRKSSRSPVRVATYDECSCPKFPKQLLLVCKQLHMEVEEILYGENKFVIQTQEKADNLNVLRTISTNAVRSLRHLLVRLNSWPCIRGHGSPFKNPKSCLICGSSARKANLEMPSHRRSQQIIEAWENVCGRLANSGIASGQLHLEFVYDVEDLQTAQRVLKPLEYLPCLKQCSIRLGRNPERELSSLARITSEKLTRKNQNTEGFRFFDLPREIRLQILWHTNTGPSSDFLADAHTNRVLNGKFDHRYPLADLHPLTKNAVRLCCLDCSFTKSHCLCPSKHASYNPSCRCQVLPLELFLTSRQMYLDASEIFYSQNPFHFQGPFTKTLSVLENMPVRLLKRLRRITFDLDSQKIFLWNHFNYYSQWRKLIRFLGKYCNPSNLLISITTTDHPATAMGFGSEEDREDIMRHIYNVYVYVVRAVKKWLPGLQDFHLFFSIYLKLEAVLEKFIMGPEYDSSHGNRYPKPRNTKWQISDAPEYLTEIPAWHTDVQEL